MARKDDIFASFITHDLVTEKYNIESSELPQNLNEGLRSNHSIIKAIALIVSNTESINPSSSKALYSQLTQFLNESI